MWVIDVSPVVASIGLAFMDQHCMQPVWNLKKTQREFKRVLSCCYSFSVAFYNVLYRKICSPASWICQSTLTQLFCGYGLCCPEDLVGRTTRTIHCWVPIQCLLLQHTALQTRDRQIDLPRVSFSTSLLQRCKQLSSTLNSSSVMWRGAGCMGRSGGSRDWVKGLWIGILCCWAAAGAVVGPDAVPELSKGGSRSCSTVLLVKLTGLQKI